MNEQLKTWLRSAYEASFSMDHPQCSYWWLGLLGVLLVLFVWWRFRRSRRNFRVFRDESGVAETTNGALRDLVRIACDGVETASKPKIQFKKKHGRIDVKIRAKLYQGQRLSEVRDQLRRRVTKIFQETHGILVGDVSFTATGFKKGEQPVADVAEPELYTPKAESKPVEKTESVPEPKAEAKEEPKAETKSFGWSEPKESAEEKKASGIKTYSHSEPKGEAEPELIKQEPEPEPKAEEPKKKSRLFGGFGNKKSEPKVDPELIEEEPRKLSGDLLEDDDFSSLLAENDPEPDQKDDPK